MTLQPLETLLVAVLALLLGRLVNRLIPALSHYNIPDPITGGLLFAIGLTLIGRFAEYHLVFDTVMKPGLLLAFFAAVGLSANLGMLKQGGKRLVQFVIVMIPFLFLQNILGLLIAWGLDMHPLMGLVGGTITLVGGHGTGAAYAERFAEVNNLQSIMELSMTAPTLGLVFGGIVGGPLAQWLIRRHRLAGGAAEVEGETGGAAAEAPVNFASLLTVLAANLVALVVGQQLAARFGEGGVVTLPTFIWCLLLGVVIRNSLPLLGVRLNDGAIDLLASLTLSLFLVMTMMALDLVQVANVAGPLLLMVVLQTVLAMLYGAWAVYRFVGRDYESAVLSASFCGFAIGSTATAMANIQAITRKHGPAPQAMVVTPLVGAFLIDLLNALALTLFLLLPWMGG